MVPSHSGSVTKDGDIYQLIYESNLENKLEQILLGLMKDNPSPKVETIIAAAIAIAPGFPNAIFIAATATRSCGARWISGRDSKAR